MSRRFLLSCLILISLRFSSAQPQAASTAGDNVASVTFTLDFPDSKPEHYSIRVVSTGPCHYESSGRLSADSDTTDSFEFDFALAPETRSKILALAQKSGYFQKDLDAHRKNLAFTGKKKLIYKDASRTGESVYNFSSSTSVQELTDLFQSLSATLEFGHRLDYDRRYQKLALDEELKRMLEMAQTRSLVEVAAIQPILERIIADQSVINVTRARARRLLDLGQ